MSNFLFDSLSQKKDFIMSDKGMFEFYKVIKSGLRKIYEQSLAINNGDLRSNETWAGKAADAVGMLGNFFPPANIASLALAGVEKYNQEKIKEGCISFVDGFSKVADKNETIKEIAINLTIKNQHIIKMLEDNKHHLNEDKNFFNAIVKEIFPDEESAKKFSDPKALAVEYCSIIVRGVFDGKFTDTKSPEQLLEKLNELTHDQKTMKKIDSLIHQKHSFVDMVTKNQGVKHENLNNSN
jgi:hypothetical protein